MGSAGSRIRFNGPSNSTPELSTTLTLTFGLSMMPPENSTINNAATVRISVESLRLDSKVPATTVSPTAANSRGPLDENRVQRSSSCACRESISRVTPAPLQLTTQNSGTSAVLGGSKGAPDEPPGLLAGGCGTGPGVLSDGNTGCGAVGEAEPLKLMTAGLGATIDPVPVPPVPGPHPDRHSSRKNPHSLACIAGNSADNRADQQRRKKSGKR